jgi:predicted nucleic acid-binding protein
VTTHLLDSSTIISISSAEHVHHGRAVDWASKTSRLALCPIVEGALVRYSVRMGASATSAQGVLEVWRARPGVELWPDDLSYADADLAQVRGHRQVTDAYLVALAAHHGGVLATLDEALATSHPEHAVLVPTS